MQEAFTRTSTVKDKSPTLHDHDVACTCGGPPK
jgi:hypothetical protein